MAQAPYCLLPDTAKRDPTQPILLDIRGLWKRYPQGDSRAGMKTVLAGVDLAISAGSFVTILGPTGCGKSTLFRTILGSEPPDQGRILVNGIPVTHPNRDRGVVFQTHGQFPTMTVVENVALGLRLEETRLLTPILRPFYYYGKKRVHRRRAMEYLERFGLADSAGKYPSELSGGMQQRAAIAQAVIMKPDLICMDEPFGALDESTREMMQLFILETWASTDMTILFVTHSLEEALYLGTRVIVLSQYYTNSDGTPAEGAKIVYDAPIPELSPRKPEVKYESWFNEMMQEIRSQGLDPSVRQCIKDFKLRHRLSIREGEEADVEIPSAITVLRPTGPEKRRFDPFTGKD